MESTLKTDTVLNDKTSESQLDLCALGPIGGWGCPSSYLLAHFQICRSLAIFCPASTRLVLLSVVSPVYLYLALDHQRKNKRGHQEMQLREHTRNDHGTNEPEESQKNALTTPRPNDTLRGENYQDKIIKRIGEIYTEVYK